MQPIRQNFRPTGGANCAYRPPLLTNEALYSAAVSSEFRSGPVPGVQSSGSMAEVNQSRSLSVGVTARSLDARGRQPTLGSRDKASEKAEAEKYTALFSRMLQENMLLSGASNPQPTSSASSSNRKSLSPAKKGHPLMGSAHQGHTVALNRISFQGPYPTTRNLVEPSSVPADRLGWTSSSEGSFRRDQPLHPLLPSTAVNVPPPPVTSLASVVSLGYLRAPAALPLGVPSVTQYHPLPTANDLIRPGLLWRPSSVAMVPAPVVTTLASVSACFGRGPVTETASKEVAEMGFLTKNLAGLHSQDILNRVNQMLAHGLFQMTKGNSDDNETTARPCSRDSRFTYSSSRGRSEDGGRERTRERRKRTYSDALHHRLSRTSRMRRRSGSKRRKRRSSHSSSSSSGSILSSSSSFHSADSNPQCNTGRNYRNSRTDPKSSRIGKREFCRICEIQIKGSFLLHRKGDTHIEKESAVQRGCDICGVRCFNTYREYEAHRSSEDHIQRRSVQQSEIDAENRKRLGLPVKKVVIIRNPDGKEQEEELAKLDRLRKMALDRKRKSVEMEKKQEEEQGRPSVIKPEDTRSPTNKEEPNSTESNAEGTTGPKNKSSGTLASASPSRGCHDDQRDTVSIDRIGRSEEAWGKRKEDERKDLERRVDAKDKDVGTWMTNQTQVTSTTIDRAAKVDCLGRQWVVPISGFFCRVCLKFFSANSGESDVTAHCMSARHRDNCQEQTPATQRGRSSSYSFTPPSSSSSFSSSSAPNAGRCGIVYDEKKQVKEIIIWKTTTTKEQLCQK